MGLARQVQEARVTEWHRATRYSRRKVPDPAHAQYTGYTKVYFYRPAVRLGQHWARALPAASGRKVLL